jgi:hypothetical protein
MPFSIDDFFAVFARYNDAIWPLQSVAFVAGLLIAALAARRRGAPAALVLAVLAAMWLVNGIGYHWLFFSGINPAARVFGAAFVLEAALLLWVALRHSDLRFSFRGTARSAIGGLLVLFALVVYPLWGRLAGHVWPAVPVLGVAPCPTTIFTIGMLFGGVWRPVRYLLVLPALWAAVGGSAAILLGAPQDFILMVAFVLVAAIGLTMELRRNA